MLITLNSSHLYNYIWEEYGGFAAIPFNILICKIEIDLLHY